MSDATLPESGIAYLPLSDADLTEEERREAISEARDRARTRIRARRDDGSRQRIRLMSDYSASPVWAEGNVPIEWLELSSELERDLVAWDALFQTRFDPLGGWCDTAAREEYARLAPALRDRLAEEVAEFADVELDLWPIDPPKG